MENMEDVMVIGPGDDYSYSLDDYGTLTVYVNDCAIAEISDCTEEGAEEMMLEVLADFGYTIIE